MIRAKMSLANIFLQAKDFGLGFVKGLEKYPLHKKKPEQDTKKYSYSAQAFLYFQTCNII